MSALPEIEPTELHGVLVVRPRVFRDERGSFTESYNSSTFPKVLGISASFVQDNESVSRENTIRGIHYQLPPHAQAKLVRCVGGAVWDVAVDLRRGSPTFGEWTSITLTAEGTDQLWIPEGFGHGFAALTDGARLLYKTTSHYEPAASRSVRWDDTELAVSWPIAAEAAVIDGQDRSAPSLAEAEVFA